jgi:hypothetical protein
MKKGLVVLLGMAFVVLLIGSVSARDTVKPGLRPVGQGSVTEFTDQTDPGLQGQYESAAVDTYCIVWYTFEQMRWQGWTRVDNTAQIDAFFHVDDFSGLGGGEYGRLVPISGTKSMWCGSRPNLADPYLCSWQKAPGYGNDWNQMLATGPIAVEGAVTWDFHAVYDAEPNCDFTHVQYDAGGFNWTDVASFTGDGETFASFFIPITTTRTKLRFHFTSDGARSDQDGLWDTDGGFIVDDIRVRDQGVYDNFEDFEAAAVGDKSVGIWTAGTEVPFGNYSGLKTNLSDKDPYNDNFATQVVFFINSPLPSTAYPGLYDTPYCMGAGGISAPCQNEMIVSPVIDMTKYSLSCDDVQNGAIPAGDLPLLGGACLGFTVYRDLPFPNLVFYQWHVRSIVDGCPGQWLDNGFLYYGSEQAYIFHTLDVSSKIAGNDPVQIAFSVVDMCNVWYQQGGDCAQHTPAPWIDNVRLYRFKAVGPRWACRAIDLFQDNFPGVDGFVRADAANDINPKDNPVIRPGDSIVVDCSSRLGGGIGTMPNGYPAVYMHVRASWIGVGEPPIGEVIHGVQLQGTCGLWLSTDAGGWDIIEADYARTRSGVLNDKFMFDLNDSLFVPGYEIDYYFTARDVAGIETALPEWARSIGPYLEFTCLPTGKSDILFVDGYSGIGSWNGLVEDYWNPVFEAVLPANNQPDRYDVSDPASGASNGPGSRWNSALPNDPYHTIVYDSGPGFSRGMKFSDAQWLLEWRETTEWAANLWIAGTGYDPYDSYWWRLQRESGLTHLKRSNEKFYNSDGTYVQAEYEGIFYEGGVPYTYYIIYPVIRWDIPPLWKFPDHLRIEIHDLDLFGIIPHKASLDRDLARSDSYAASVKASLVWDLRPPDGNTYYAAIQSEDTSAAGYPIKTMWFGFSYMNLGNALPPTPSVPSARFWIAQKVFAWMSNETRDPYSGTTTPAAYGLAQNFPNPFNPATTIKFDMKEKGLVTLRIYNVAGQLVRTLLKSVKDAGGYSIPWDGKNDRGVPVATGIYLYKMEAPGFTATKKMVVLR